jgi:hypothetical protein
MRTEQEQLHAVTYWVLRDIKSDEIYADTFAKLYSTCANLAFTLYDYHPGNPNLCISLVEIKLVEFETEREAAEARLIMEQICEN